MRIPKEGDTFTTADFDMVIEAVQQRAKNFPGEPASLTLSLVMMNIGDRFTPVTCDICKWTGIKHDLSLNDLEGNMLCPDAHPVKSGPKLTLGWVTQ